MDYQALLLQFIENSLLELKDNLITGHKIEGTLNITYYLDFLAVGRQSARNLPPFYQINMSNIATPNFMTGAVPLYVPIDRYFDKFEFEMALETYSGEKILAEIVESELDDVPSTEQMSLKTLLLMGLFQLSYKKLADEESRLAYSSLVTDTKFYLDLYRDWMHCQLGIKQNEVIFEALSKLLTAINEAVQVIREDVLSKLDKELKPLAKKCSLNGQVSIKSYRRLISGIDEYVSFIPLLENDNYAVIKLMTNFNLEIYRFPLSEQELEELKTIPTSKVYGILHWMEEYFKYESQAPTLAFYLKVGMVHNKLYGADEPFPLHQLRNLSRISSSLRIHNDADDLIVGFVRLAHLTKDWTYDEMMKLYVGHFGGNEALNSVFPSDTFDPTNLLRIHADVNEADMKAMIVQWYESKAAA